MSVDAREFSINKPRRLEESWYSHKFHGPGVRYDVALSIEIPKIVWANGRWPWGACGSLKNILNFDEFATADSVYADERCIQPPGPNQLSHCLLATIRAVHENLNKRLKQLVVLKLKFR